MAAGRPAKTLEDHLRQGSFRARRHADLLLVGELLRDAVLRVHQLDYRLRDNDEERNEVALLFQAAAKERARVRAGHELTTAERWYMQMGPGFGDWTGAAALGFRLPDNADAYAALQRRWEWWNSRYGPLWRRAHGQTTQWDLVVLYRRLTGDRRTLNMHTIAAVLDERADEVDALAAAREPLTDPPGLELLADAAIRKRAAAGSCRAELSQRAPRRLQR